MISFRWLAADEYDKIVSICREFNWVPPHPAVGAVRIAEEDGEVVGIVCTDVLAHLGPAWIKPGHRFSRRIWEEGFSAVREKLEPTGLLPGVILLAETPATEKIAERLGMVRSKGVLYEKRWR